MKFDPPLLKGKLIKRYKRFLADIIYQNQIVTIHCPNTGAMTGCQSPGHTIYFSESNNPKRKYPHTFELYQTEKGDLVGINTHNANKLVKEALNQNIISGFEHWKLQSEVKIEDSRLDFLMTRTESQDRHYIEVKSVTLEKSGIGYFPDAVSERALKHVRMLQHIADLGEQATLIFCVQHTGVDVVRPATFIQPEYQTALQQALLSGVNIRAFKCGISPELIEIQDEIQVVI